MKITINLDDKKNDILFTSFIVCMIGLFIFSFINKFTDNFLIYNVIAFITVFLVFSSESKTTSYKTKHKYRLVSIIGLIILVFFKGWVNIPMLIFTIVLAIYFILRSFTILEFKRTNPDTGEYEYL